MWDGAKKTWQLKWSNSLKNQRLKIARRVCPWAHEPNKVHLGAAKLLSNYFACRKRRENIQPFNPNVKWLLELLKKSWPLLHPIQIKDMKAHRIDGLLGCPRKFFLFCALDRNSTTQMRRVTTGLRPCIPQIKQLNALNEVRLPLIVGGMQMDGGA